MQLGEGAKLAEEVKKDVVEELLKISSFIRDHKETLAEYRELIDWSEKIVKNKPAEIVEKAILETYPRGKEVNTSLSIISREIGKIRNLLIDLEWVKDLTDLRDYSKLWIEKQTAIKKNDLESIAKALEGAKQKANEWKEARKREIDGALLRIERMLKSVEKDELKKGVTSLREKTESINWNKPDLESLSEALSEKDRLREQLREELIKRLQNEDAISMIEEPEIIRDLGKERGWDFERFIKALEAILRNGLIEIRAVEER